MGYRKRFSRTVLLRELSNERTIAHHTNKHEPHITFLSQDLETETSEASFVVEVAQKLNVFCLD